MNDSYLEKDFGAWIVARKSADAILAGNTNAVYSPACIYEGLRVIRLGAGGKTAEELDGLLGTGALDSDWLGLERIDEWSYDEYLARIAAGVWLDEKAKPSDEFANACERESIPVTVTRLSNPTAGEEITRWISEKTEGLLSPSIDLDPRALACVASALYLKDAWEHEFPKESTERKPFHADGGDIDADFMVSEAELPLADTGVGTVVGYPLSNGAMMSFLLPKEGMSLGEIVSDGSAIDAMADFTPTPTDVELHLPKFACETTVDDMAAALKAAGFTSVDNPDLLPMTGMGDTPTSYIHGARIAVDENGLEAGAYFAMVACAGALPEIWEPPVPRVIVFDRPFAYAVVSRTGQPLFLGVVARPEADPLSWVPYHSDDEKGSENGWITEDEEIPGVCRITLEEDGDTAPYAITCGVYGLMMHTTWEGDYKAAMSKYEGMKKELQQCAELIDGEDFDAGTWCEEFTSKW